MTDKFEDNLNAAMETSKRIIDEHNVAEQKRQEEERLKKEQAKWESGVVAESVEQFEEFLKKGYKPTYESCGGAKLSSKNGVNILKLACQYGLESEEATKLFVQSKDPEIMEILVKEGKADVCKYPMKKIQEWYDTPDTIRKDPDTIEKRPIQKRVEKERPVYREERNPDYWNKGGNGLNEVYDGDRGWEPHYIKTVVGYESYFDYETVYEDVRHEGKKHVIKNNEGAMPAFKKLVKLGYKPETPVDAKAFTYMAEKLNKIIAEKKRIAEENAKYEAEQKRRDSEIEKIGDCPLGQKLLAAALIKAGIMNDHSQVDSMENVLTNDFQRKELKKLRQKEIISEKFEILKPYEFSQSEFFTDRVTLGLTSIYQVQKVPMINTFRDKAEKQHDAEIKAQKAKEAAERKAKEAQKEAERKAEENAKYEAEQKRRDSEIEKIGDCPLGQKLLAAALIKSGVMKDHTQIDSIYYFLTRRQALEVELLQLHSIMSEKFEILKPWEFINSQFFTRGDGHVMKKEDISNIENIPLVKTFRDEAEKQHEAEIKAEKLILQKIKDDTPLQDIIAEIKQMNQETINYIADYMAKYPAKWRPDDIGSNNKVKALAVSLAIYDKSTGVKKNMLKSELLKARIGHYRGEYRKEMLDLFQKAKKMLNGEITEDVTVKGLTRKSYTPNSSLNKALKENNIERYKGESR